MTTSSCASAPSVTTSSATSVTGTTATLNGTFTMNGVHLISIGSDTVLQILEIAPLLLLQQQLQPFPLMVQNQQEFQV